MTTEGRSLAVSHRRVALARGAAFLVFWIILLPSAKPADLMVGGLAIFAATWASLVLLPPEAGRLRFGGLLAMLPHFLWQSVLAGVDVARRAFDPRMPLRPGFVSYPVGFRSSTARNTFTTITSLLPGTVPCGVENGALVYHCLDTSQPVVAELAAEEQRLAAFIVEAPHA